MTEISKDQEKQFYKLLKDFIYFLDSQNVSYGDKILKREISNYRKYKNNKSICKTILKGSEDTKIFCLCDDKKNVVGFEIAQIFDDKGYKEIMYFKEEIRNTVGMFKDLKGNVYKNEVCLALDREVEKWFEENGITIQETSTGVNMTKNIIVYIGLGYVPYKISGKLVYFIKDKSKQLITPEIKRMMIKDLKEGKIPIFDIGEEENSTLTEEKSFKASLKKGALKFSTGACITYNMSKADPKDNFKGEYIK